MLQLKLLNFSLLLIDERGGDKLKLKHWHKSEYRTILIWMIVICNREKLRDWSLFVAWGGPEDIQGGHREIKKHKGGHLDFNNLQGGRGHHFGKTISQILQALHTVRAK